MECIRIIGMIFAERGTLIETAGCTHSSPDLPSLPPRSGMACQVFPRLRSAFWILARDEDESPFVSSLSNEKCLFGCSHRGNLRRRNSLGLIFYQNEREEEEEVGRFWC